MTRFAKYNNEKGFALILALSMLAIMSILGAFALMTSTTEVQISGNYSAAQQAFYAADRPVEIIDSLIGNNINNALETLEENDTINLSVWDNDLFFNQIDGRSGLIAGELNSISAVFDRTYNPYMHVYYTTTLTGGFFATPNQPRQRVRIEVQKELRRLMTSSTGSGDLQTTDGGG